MYIHVYRGLNHNHTCHSPHTPTHPLNTHPLTIPSLLTMSPFKFKQCDQPCTHTHTHTHTHIHTMNKFKFKFSKNCDVLPFKESIKSLFIITAEAPPTQVKCSSPLYTSIRREGESGGSRFSLRRISEIYERERERDYVCMCVCSDILSNMSLTPVMCLIESDEEDTCSGEESK